MKNLFFIFTLIMINFNQLFAQELNIYSHRQPFLINPFLEAFTSETGIKTNVVYSTKGLAQRLQSRLENTACSCAQLRHTDRHAGV